MSFQYFESQKKKKKYNKNTIFNYFKDLFQNY